VFRQRRIKSLRTSLRGVDALLVTDLANVRYLTGFTGSSGSVLLTREACFFLTDFRYEEQSAREMGDLAEVQVIISRRGALEALRRLFRKKAVRRLGVEQSITLGAYERLSGVADEVRALREPVERLREQKDAEELRAIRGAVSRAEEAFRQVLPHIRVGVRERSVALRLEERLKRKGCRRVPFDIIVASGPNSALPHAGVTERRMAPGDLVTVDWGGESGGYYSDMTRTVLLRGTGTGPKRDIYRAVLRANREARAAVRPGRGTRQIDKVARDSIKKAGYGDFFGHGLGHGVGLAVHEAPRLNRIGNAALRPGMVFTIEPGVYVPGVGGVRIEDMVALGAGGAEVLTSLPRGLHVIG
jgi:Xaa-Pro aminopeptidase